MTEQSDADILAALEQARASAPPPIPWHDVVERRDRRHGSRSRTRVRAAAAVAAIGTVGLIAAVTLRDGADPAPADTPRSTTTALAVTPETNPTLPLVDPLADIGNDTWVVPSDMPPRYRRATAYIDPGVGHARDQIFASGDADPILHLNVQNGKEVPDSESEKTEIDGIAWYRSSFDGGSAGSSISYSRVAGAPDRKIVSVHAIGDPAVVDDLLTDFIRSLVIVPESEIEFQFLDPSEPHTLVATTGGTEPFTLSAIGLNGYYCLTLDDSQGTSSSAGCEHTTSETAPVTVIGGMGSPSGSASWGLAEPDIAQIDFHTSDGATLTAFPDDESGQFDRRFWIVKGAGLNDTLGPDSIDRVVITRDDGSTVELESTPLGRWRLPNDAAG